MFTFEVLKNNKNGKYYIALTRNDDNEKPIHIMQELIKKIMENAEISAGQTMKVLETIKDYVKEQFPMMGDAVDKLFEGAGGSDSNAPGMHADKEDYI